MIAFVASVQLEPVSHASVGEAATVVALLESVFGVPPPVEKIVEVAVMFQPAPDPVASPTSRAWVAPAVWSTPPRVALNETAGGADTNPRDPAEIVAVAELAPAGAVDAMTPPAATAPAARMPSDRRSRI
ncbi:MAG: hypothetical protein JOZ99_10890 [Actinobacteria bacterium]|nr:hypothetical protein [Actinomycetota bacterium]